jgi:EEF1A lysine methyltransferase 4
MNWVVMDMTELTFEDRSFDVVIDKAAMDALTTEEGDVWAPELPVRDHVTRLVNQIASMRKESGAPFHASLRLVPHP